MLRPNAGKPHFCIDCYRFHPHDSIHKTFNRNLCFYCEKKQQKKTKIIESDAHGWMQICDTCYINLEHLPSRPYLFEKR